MKTILCSLVFFVIFAGCFSLECFVCNSNVDEACGDHFMENSTAIFEAFKTNCEPKEEGEVYCRKMVMSIHQMKSEVRVHRDCAYARREGKDCYQRRAEDYVLDICHCQGPYCNEAPPLFKIGAVLLMPLMSLVLL